MRRVEKVLTVVYDILQLLRARGVLTVIQFAYYVRV